MQALEAIYEPQREIQLFSFRIQPRWLIASCVSLFHLAAILLLTFNLHGLKTKKVAQKILVRTVTLNSPATNTYEQPAAPEPMAAPIQAAAPAEPAIEEKAIEEKAVEEPAPKPVSQIEPKAPPKKVEVKKPPVANKVKPKPAPKPIPKPKPKPKVQPKPVPKSVPKPVPKPKPEPKTAAKEAQANDKALKEKAVKEKAAKEKAAQEKAAKEKAAREKAAEARAAKERAQKEKQNALVAAALSSLDSAGKIDNKKGSLAKESGKVAASGPASISNLASESMVTVVASDTACSPYERSYYDELVGRLKLSLKLPEYGQIKLQLTVSSTGKVLSVKGVKSKSKKNSDYVNKTLPKLMLPPFGQNFPGEKEHTFQLTLSNELNY